ncbi:Trm112 family protein [Thermodesulfatator atlanticus]|uniref:Trm112 family protein n=1 Tax=Thermodesulfatator atlanticus TaxID=501497 RepID=UPI00048E697B|nr:Trm112 family protein [Thermodesulfatator atlanticus]
MFDGLFVSLIPQELLAILACPKCKGDLVLDEAKSGLICHKCALLYEIRDGIPIMLVEEAKPLKEEKAEKENE